MTDKKTPREMFMDSPPDLSPKEYEPVRETEAPAAPEPCTENADAPAGNIVDLPSKGILGYPGSISHREIMAGDEEILKTSTNKNFSRTVNRVLKSICNDADWFDDMYLGDRDYVMTHIWGNTYDPNKEFEIKCSHCGAKEPRTVNIFDLKSIDMHEKFKSRFPLKIAKTGDTVNVRLVTVRDDNNAEKYLADNPEIDHTYEFIHYALALEFGRPMSVEARIQYLKDNASSREMGIIRDYHRVFRFGLDSTFEHECSRCKGVTKSEIPFLPEDFIAPQLRTDFESLL